MPRVKIPIKGTAYQNVEEVSLNALSPIMIDCYEDESGSTVKRPGLGTAIIDFGTGVPIDGIYWWDKKKKVYAVSGGAVYSIDNNGANATALGGEYMEIPGNRPIFTDSGDDLFISDGGKILVVNSEDAISTPLFNGVGDDDLTTSGTATSAGAFKVVIDGESSSVTFDITNSNVNLSDGNTITIDTTVYRFKNTLAAINDIKIGSSAIDSMNNLYLAINGSGTEGINYYDGTVANTVFFSGEPFVASAGLLRMDITARASGSAANGKTLNTNAGTIIKFNGVSTLPQTTSGGTSGSFKWSSNGGATYSATLVSITGAAQALSGGVSITLTNTATHTIGDTWDFYTKHTTPYLLPNLVAPTKVSHTSFIDGYLLANNLDNQRVSFSENANVQIFNGDYISAEADSDDVVAINSSFREINIFGRASLESWWDDGTTPFSRLEASFAQRGTISPYTIQFCNNTWHWFDNNRRVVRLDGRTPKIISTPFDKTFSGFVSIEDAYSIVLYANGKNFYVLSFPTERRSFAYDFQLDKWTEFGFWDSQNGEYQHFIGCCSVYCPDWGITLVGDRRDSKIYAISSDNTNDGGSSIRMKRLTANFDHGTSARKRSNKMVLRLRRGVGDANTEPYLTLRYRDDGGSFGNSIQVSLGKQGVGDFFVELNRNGIYRSRQIEITQSTSHAMTLVEIEEDIEVLR